MIIKLASKPELSGEIVLALYIAKICYSNISKLSVTDSWERTVYYLFCNPMATLKSTETGSILLRCNTCSVMGFRQLNAIAAENPDLRDLRFTSVH
jgi:hypothetical protein